MSIPSGADPETMNSTFVGSEGAGEEAAAVVAGAAADDATAATPEVEAEGDV